MPASTLAGTRSTLAAAFSSLAATSYAYVPESPIPPAIVIVPSSPYPEQQLIMGILAAVPAGYVVGNVERPTPLEVGASTMLTADINVSTTYTQTS